MNRQTEQQERYRSWVETEGGVDRPQRISTFLNPVQIERLEWLKHLATPPILEVGCNWGYVLAYANGQAGLDQSFESIDIARQLAPDRQFQVGIATDLPYPTDSFDTVMLPEVLSPKVTCAPVESKSLSSAIEMSISLTVVPMPMDLLLEAMTVIVPPPDLRCARYSHG